MPASFLLFWAKHSPATGRMMEEQLLKSVRFLEGPVSDCATPPPGLPEKTAHRLLKTRATCPNLDEGEELTELRSRLAEVGRKSSMSPTSREESEEITVPTDPLPSPLPQKPLRPLSISPVQMNLVRKSWANAKTRGKVEPIANIFHHSMFKCPEMRVLLERGGSTGAKDHVILFLDLFEALMETLEDTASISLQLRSIGKEHVRLWDIGFRAAHFDVLIQSLLDATLKWGEKPVRTADCQTAWAEICSFIVEELKEGFHGARKMSKRKPSLKAF